ncbi:hypothetical protein AJ80_04953 [Polytolypa hystricis UAMH7299]|uniref:Ubiquitin-protein ligase n=1 Tax=Polytolypa hystricis (strain UAMH7299) TaxID=1447883 RepID=A0A2B7Y797_POLH7|nr:hypothetical protein AJ80_04953 [Polytolypa hystricis UAMH7299]
MLPSTPVDAGSVAEATAAAANVATASISPSALSSNSSFVASLLPSPKDLALLPLRVVYRAEVFMFATVPRNIMRLMGIDTAAAEIVHGGADAVAAAAVLNTDAPEIAAAAAAAAAAGAQGAADGAGSNLVDMLQSMRKFGGFFSYMTSKWSLTCFAVALALNRVTIYAATRRQVSLKWQRRLALRIVAIVLLLLQVLTLLRAIRCQTSPEYSVFRYGKPGKHSSLDYSGGGGFLYNLSSLLLFWEDDQGSCSAVKMGRPIKGPDVPYGSFSLLWPVFLKLSLAHFTETLSCTLQGRTLSSEAGMSIFEHSLAYAEAETMISQSIGLGLFGLPKTNAPAQQTSTGSASSSAAQLFTRTQVLERLNVTPELLLISLISCSNGLASSILDVFGVQHKYRLIHTTIWGLSFMGAMIFGLIDSTPLGSNSGVLRFPTVCIVGFVPHLLILIGILTCIVIYCIALLLTAFSLPADLPEPTSLRERFSLAHENMQGASHIRNIRLNMREDFYTALVRIGYSALTAASEAVFLNEGKSVVARGMTWLEEDRLTEIERLRGQSSSNTQQGRPQPMLESSGGLDETFRFAIPERSVEWETGYGQEKKFDKSKKGARSMESRGALGGVGAFQGVARCYHGLSFFKGIFYLLLGWSAFGLIKFLERIGITSRPQWLEKLSGVARRANASGEKDATPSLDFWILTDQGVLELPEDNEFDVEKEMRKRELANASSWTGAEENLFDRKLYNWWKAGGAWGNQDTSGDYKPPEDDDWDNTSVASMSTNNDSEWEAYESDGRRTPTQENPYSLADPRISRYRSTSPTPEPLLDTRALARLLDPKDNESRHEARILASHLTSAHEGKIMTRNRFRKQLEMESARVLTSNRYNRAHFQSAVALSSGKNLKRKPTPDEEAEILENLLLSRRLGSSPGTSSSSRGSRDRSEPQQQSWATGASGLGSDGPQCVICQAAPRAIITWPCRCLCICEDCRVSLAMNNFGSCVTCRREVSGFVRLWVP